MSRRGQIDVDDLIIDAVGNFLAANVAAAGLSQASCPAQDVRQLSRLKCGEADRDCRHRMTGTERLGSESTEVASENFEDFGEAEVGGCLESGVEDVEESHATTCHQV